MGEETASRRYGLWMHISKFGNVVTFHEKSRDTREEGNGAERRGEARRNCVYGGLAGT